MSCFLGEEPWKMERSWWDRAETSSVPRPVETGYKGKALPHGTWPHCVPSCALPEHIRATDGCSCFFFFFFSPKAMLKGRPGWLGAGCLVLQVKEGPSASGRGRAARRAYCLLSIRSTLIRTRAFQTDGPASFPERSARRGRWKSFHGFKWDFSQALEWKELDLGEGLHFCTSPLLPCASPGSGGCIPSPRWSMWHQAPKLGAEPSPPPGAISRSW